MSYDHYLILYILHKLKGERSIQAVYHLFRGKKSSQTIQDSLFFKLSELFETAVNIKMEKLLQLTTELVKQQAIEEKYENHFVLTSSGLKLLGQMEAEYSIPETLNGYRYGKVAHHLWPRLTLIVQSLSFLMERKHSYTPITRNQQILLSVKDFLKGKNKYKVSKTLYKEIFDLLSSLRSQDRDMVVLRLSGSHRVGLTIEQLAKRYKMSWLQCQIVFEAILHTIITKLVHQPEHYALLYSLIDYKVKSQLTESTSQTYAMLQKGMSIETIVNIRGLKLSTIEDHLVEIALLDSSFDIDPYVPDAVAREIKDIITQTDTQRLRKIKDQLSEQVSYLQIRLVLAKETPGGQINA